MNNLDSNWRLIFPESTDPFLNLALDEILFQQVQNQKSGQILRFWKATPCCIIGRNQYLPQEINQEYCRKNNILIIRRISGGGAVYLDLGCLNFSIIFKNEGSIHSTDLINSFLNLTEPIINALRSLSFHVKFQPPNSIYYQKRKISGSAQFRRGKHVLFHGTLLLYSDLTTLIKSLTPIKNEEYKRAIKSNRVEIANLFQNRKDLVPQINIILTITKTFGEKFRILPKKDRIHAEEIKKAEKLIISKYSSLNWTNRLKLKNQSKFIN